MLRLIVDNHASCGEDPLRWYRSCWHTQQLPSKLGRYGKTMFVSVPPLQSIIIWLQLWLRNETINLTA